VRGAEGSSSSKIKNPEFADWQFMTVTVSGFWIYQNPENTQNQVKPFSQAPISKNMLEKPVLGDLFNWF